MVISTVSITTVVLLVVISKVGVSTVGDSTVGITTVGITTVVITMVSIATELLLGVFGKVVVTTVVLLVVIGKVGVTKVGVTKEVITSVDVHAEVRAEIAVWGINPSAAIGVSLRFAKATETDQIVVVGAVKISFDSEDFSEIDECILVDSDGLGRLGMGERDVVATIVITTVHGVLVHPGQLIGVVLVQRLPSRFKASKIEFSELGHIEDDAILGALAVLVDSEEVLNIFADDGELGADNGLLEATEIVVLKQDLLLLLHFLGELGVDQEDRGWVLHVVLFNWLENTTAWDELTRLGFQGQHGVRGALVANRCEDQLVSRAHFLGIVREGAGIATHTWVGHAGGLPLEVWISGVVRGPTREAGSSVFNHWSVGGESFFSEPVGAILGGHDSRGSDRANEGLFHS